MFIQPSQNCVWGSPKIRPRSIGIYHLHYSLSNVIQRHNVKHHLYADDTQIGLYLSLSLKYPDISLEILPKCLQDMSSWMSSRKLKLNPDKTDFLLIGSKVQHENFSKCFLTRWFGTGSNSFFIC